MAWNQNAEAIGTVGARNVRRAKIAPARDASRSLTGKRLILFS